MSSFQPFLDPQVIIPRGTRVYAIGDIHGYLKDLRGIIDAVHKDLGTHPLAHSQNYLMAFLGDYLDRGPDSKHVVETLMRLQKDNPRHIFLSGNHEKDFMDVLRRLSGDLTVPRHEAEQTVIANPQTYISYGVPTNYRVAWELSEMKSLLKAVPESHQVFLQNLPRSARMGSYLFVHDPLHTIGNPECWSSSDRDAAMAYIWGRSSCTQLPVGHPVRQKIIVHGHRTGSWCASPENLDHRIGLNDHADEGSHRVAGAVLECGRPPRFLSHTSTIECHFP